MPGRLPFEQEFEVCIALGSRPDPACTPALAIVFMNPSRFASLLLLLLLVVWFEQTWAQSTPITQSPALRNALEFLRIQEPETLNQQARICEIPAPTFEESARAEYFRNQFVELGLKDVHTDAVGNVLGTRPGRSTNSLLVFSAHLDTVFPAGTDTRVQRIGSILKAPGIADDCRGLAVLLAVLRALNQANLQTEENEFWKTQARNPLARVANNRTPLSASIEPVGRRPTGRVAEDAPILAAVRRANEALGVASKFEPMSTDSNIPISLGIPAVTLGSDGDASGSHSLAEQFDSKDSHLGTQRALLVLLELARVGP